jgi:hypothetical protein
MTYLGNSRRNFLKTLTTSTLISTTSVPTFASVMHENNKNSNTRDLEVDKSGMHPNDTPSFYDGPASPHFNTVDIIGNTTRAHLQPGLVSERMAEAVNSAPKGKGTAWGIPFLIPENIIYLKNEIHEIQINPISGNWLVFLHTADLYPLIQSKDGLYEKPFKGIGHLNEAVANYVIVYEDGNRQSLPVHLRYQVGMFQQIWGENCIESVAHHKPRPVRFHHEQTSEGWGWTQTKVAADDRGNWINWLWAWENPYPDKKIVGFQFEPLNKIPVILSAISYGKVQSHPLRWNSRQKALLTLPEGTLFDPVLHEHGLLNQVQLDLGQIISAVPRSAYPNSAWEASYNNQIPEISSKELIIEYAAHPEAQFHLFDKEQIPVGSPGKKIMPINPANKTLRIMVQLKDSGKLVPVKFHAHGEKDEYLAPINRHRGPNNAWFEDYSVDFVNRGTHNCTYIPGETVIKLPIGKVFLEISKGFEIKPIRKVVEITQQTELLTIEIEKSLFWREKGWVTADTHVHFLSPHSAQLEGEGEGVNIVNLLASQWGELMTNVGDFDGKSTFGSKEAGGSGEYLVRVGTENRQHVMGHISLLGYEGNMITPMTTGGADESAIGDPIEVLLTEWARQCKNQDGIVVLPHFPNPRLENAAAIVTGNIDGVEMTSWGNLYGGIDPYSLTDWYRYLNCGYFVAAVGGTDKMSADTAVGTVRTYARIPDNQEFTYDAWKESVRKGHTFVTYGPLIDFNVDGKPAGSQIEMSSGGGTVDISWEVASVTVPMTKVELVVNGEVRESVSVSQWKGSGNWRLPVTKSSWAAILVRGHYPDQPEIITTHTSPVMIRLNNSQMLAAADALTILEQIEGAMAYLDTIGTRADEKTYKRMRMVLTSAHRTVHNRMHEMGYYHQHTPTLDHPEHH